MLLTLLKAVDTKDLEKLVRYMSLPPIDIDVMLYEAIKNGDIEVNKRKGTIKALKAPEEAYFNEKLLEQMKKVIHFYDDQEANITESRLEQIVLDPMGLNGYLKHDFYCTLLKLKMLPEVKKYEIKVAKNGPRPAHTFVFYTFLDHQEFGAKAVNDFIKQFAKK